jgi:hypothetical protein
MKNSEFIVWLQGYLELCPEDILDIRKLRIIRNHLNLVQAVEGQLSDLNQSYRTWISDLIDGKEKLDDETRLRLYAMMLPLLQNAFPDGFQEIVHS